MEILEKLKRSISEKPRPTFKSSEDQVELEFQKLQKLDSSERTGGIPTFFSKRVKVEAPDRSSVTLHQRISQAAKIRRLRQADPNNHSENQSSESSQHITGDEPSCEAASVYQWLLSDGELESVWLAIEAHLLTVAVPPDLQLPEDASDVSDDARVAAAIAATAAGERLNYEGFLDVVPTLAQYGAHLPDKMRRFFLPSVFLRFVQDEFGTISARALYHFIIRKVGLVQHRLTLSLFDLDNTGYLTAQDLEQYILSQLPVMAQFQDFQESFYPFYVATALARFFFLLDPHRRRKLNIRDLITSEPFRQFNELRQAVVDERALLSNWFSPRAALRVRAMFVNLDTDRDQCLCRWELLRFSDGNVTPIFVDRLLEEYADVQSGAGPALSYQAVLHYLLAAEHRALPVGLAYFWRVLDIDRRGHLTLATLNVFLREVRAKMSTMRLDVLPIEHMTNELFDMIRPADGVHITLADLQACRLADVVCAMLTDVNAFYLYFNRENFVHLASINADTGMPSFVLYFHGNGYSLSPPGVAPQSR